MNKLKESDIVLWIVSFDDDGFSYVHHKMEMVLNTIRDFAEDVLVDMTQKDKDVITNRILDLCVANIDGSGPAPYVKLNISEKIIHVERLVLDKHTIIHKIMCDMYPLADSLNKQRIDSIFQHSNC